MPDRLILTSNYNDSAIEVDLEFDVDGDLRIAVVDPDGNSGHETFLEDGQVARLAAVLTGAVLAAELDAAETAAG